MASTTGSNAFNYALTAVDKVAGRKTKEQIESLAQSKHHLQLYNPVTLTANLGNF